MVRVESGGAQSRETAAALATLHAAIQRLAGGDGATAGCALIVHLVLNPCPT
jgi:hypothetical protein